ncbi:MAG: ELM1/GtrOC1 family putative glycosyltransferase [Gammaproteobacteria bacterium]
MISAPASGGRAVSPSLLSRRARVVWRFSDGRPGHDNQSLGLVEALGRCLSVEPHTVSVPENAATWRDLISGCYAAGARLPDPWLLVGAGRRTHLPLLAAGRARHGRTVVIMRPAFHLSLYDLCIIPDHDAPAPAPNVLISRGSLNRAQRVTGQERVQGMILVGGPSRHYRWRDDAVAAQIARVIRYSPAREWVLATSRRTPAGFAEQVRCQVDHAETTLTLLTWQGEDSGPRVAAQLGRSRCAWVTEDSVSMVYEALSAGVATGLLDVPGRGRGRVVEGIRRLAATGQVTGFGDWAAGKPLQPPGEIFDEANRSARWICEQWGASSSRS